MGIDNSLFLAGDFYTRQRSEMRPMEKLFRDVERRRSPKRTRSRVRARYYNLYFELSSGFDHN